MCIKNVPDATATIRLVDQTTINNDIPYEMNPPDEFALEAALKLREQMEQEAHVILVTCGMDLAENMIRHGLAMGADRAIQITSDAYSTDSQLTTQLLAKAIEQDGQPDLILTGSCAMDSEGMQTPYRLASYFNLPVTTNIIKCEFQDGRARVHREIDDGDQEVISLQMPCLLGIERAVEDPRTPKIRDIMKARKKEVKKIAIDQLGLSSDHSHNPSKTEILKLELPPEKTPAKILEGDVKEITQELMQMLREEAKVL